MNFYKKRRAKPILQIISMIDLLIVLLLFLVVSTSFKEATSTMQLSLPSSNTGKGATEKSTRLLLAVGENGAMMLGDAPVVMENLEAAIRGLRELRPDAKFSLKIDKNVSFGVSIKILDALKQAGCKAEDFNIITAKN